MRGALRNQYAVENLAEPTAGRSNRWSQQPLVEQPLVQQPLVEQPLDRATAGRATAGRASSGEGVRDEWT